MLKNLVYLDLCSSLQKMAHPKIRKESEEGMGLVATITHTMMVLHGSLCHSLRSTRTPGIKGLAPGELFQTDHAVT